MAFIKETLEALQCDNCKDTYQNENSGFSFWLDRNEAWENADVDGWAEDGDKHYCASCHTYNDDDELLIASERFKAF